MNASASSQHAESCYMLSDSMSELIQAHALSLTDASMESECLHINICFRPGARPNRHSTWCCKNTAVRDICPV